MLIIDCYSILIHLLHVLIVEVLYCNCFVDKLYVNYYYFSLFYPCNLYQFFYLIKVVLLLSHSCCFALLLIIVRYFLLLFQTILPISILNFFFNILFGLFYPLLNHFFSSFKFIFLLIHFPQNIDHSKLYYIKYLNYYFLELIINIAIIINLII